MTTPYEEIENLLASAELEAANAAISELLEKNADDIDALVFNARLLGSTGRSDDAMSNLNKALNLDGSHIYARTFKAAMLYESGTYDEAEKILGEVLHIDANIHAASYNMARCQARKNDFKEALNFLNKAIDGDPENAHYLFAKANTLDELGQPAEAFAALKASVEANPGLERGWYVLCTWLLDMGQAKEALSNLEQAIQFIPTSDALSELLGRAAVESDNAGRAMEVFGTLLDKNPENSGIWFNFGAANLAAENLEDAEVAFRKAMALDPNDVDAMHELANLIQLSEDPAAMAEAEKLLGQVIEKTPNSWEAHNDLGRMYLGQEAPESREKGLRCFEKAVEITGNDPLVVFNLALASAELEDLGRARELCEQLVNNPETPDEIRTRAADLQISLSEAK